MIDNNENFMSFINEMGILLKHIRDHASLRGEIYQLDTTCRLCKKYFADKLSIVFSAAAHT